MPKKDHYVMLKVTERQKQIIKSLARGNQTQFIINLIVDYIVDVKKDNELFKSFLRD